MNMNVSRRHVLRGLSLLIGVAALPGQLFARATGAFQAKEVDQVMQQLFGDLKVTLSDQVILKIPSIAENGAVVPVTVSSDVAGAEAVYIVIDANPNPLSATFELGPTSPADVSTRVKMGQSSMVRGLVKTPDGVLMAQQEVKVTIGGCGG